MKISDARNFWRSRGVPEEALDDLSDLAEAARIGDARVEEWSGGSGEGIVHLLREAGWHEEAIKYIAEQRCLRVETLIRQGGKEALESFTRQMDPMLMRSSQPILLALLMTWYDGFAVCQQATALKAKR